MDRNHLTKGISEDCKRMGLKSKNIRGRQLKKWVDRRIAIKGQASGNSCISVAHKSERIVNQRN